MIHETFMEYRLLAPILNQPQRPDTICFMTLTPAVVTLLHNGGLAWKAGEREYILDHVFTETTEHIRNEGIHEAAFSAIQY